MDDRISNCGLDGKVIIKRRNENWRSLLVTFESLRSQFYLILNNHLMAKKIHWKYILLSKQQAEKNIFDLTSDLFWLSNAHLRGKNFNSSFWFSLVSIFRKKVENLPTWTWLFPTATFAMAKVGNQEVKILSDVQLLVALVVSFRAIRLEFFSNRMNLIKNISKHVAKSPRSFCCFGFASRTGLIFRSFDIIKVKWWISYNI